jgi:hypothetical protein
MAEDLTPQQILQAAALADPELANAIRQHYQPRPAVSDAPAAPEPVDVPELPPPARLPDSLGADVGPWLEDYIAFSRKWSPRSYDGFHEACALWLLSTIAARRIKTDFGRPRYPALYLLLAGRSSLNAKSTAADIATEVIHQLGMEYLLAPKHSSPQKFLSLLTSRLPENYDVSNVELKELTRKRLGLRGARGWFVEEFGGTIQSMMQPSGFMAEFRNILRIFDDCPYSFETATHARDLELIQAPYLALLGNVTPADLSKYAQRGSELWSDGLLARFAIISPGPDEGQKTGRFPLGYREVPYEILKPLKDWDARLGKAEVRISPAPDKTDEIVGFERVEVRPAKETAIAWTGEVNEAYYRYLDALGQLARGMDNPDFDASYIRLAEKALRIAVLLASLNQREKVELRFWARAQAITERWRASLHAFYEQVNQGRRSPAGENEERVLRVIHRHGPLSPAEVGRYIRGIGALEAKQVLDGLVETGLLVQCPAASSRTLKYGLAEP